MDAKSCFKSLPRKCWFGGFGKWYADPNAKTKGIVLITLHKKKTCFGSTKKNGIIIFDKIYTTISNFFIVIVNDNSHQFKKNALGLECVMIINTWILFYLSIDPRTRFIKVF
jgi:hypothetical protein